MNVIRMLRFSQEARIGSFCACHDSLLSSTFYFSYVYSFCLITLIAGDRLVPNRLIRRHVFSLNLINFSGFVTGIIWMDW